MGASQGALWRSARWGAPLPGAVGLQANRYLVTERVRAAAHIEDMSQCLTLPRINRKSLKQRNTAGIAAFWIVPLEGGSFRFAVHPARMTSAGHTDLAAVALSTTIVYLRGGPNDG